MMRGLMVAACCLASSHLWAGNLPEGGPAYSPTEQLEKIDAMISELQSDAWDAQSRCRDFVPDPLGRSCGATWLEFHATTTAVAALNKARALVAASKDAIAVDAQVIAAGDIIASQQAAAFLLDNYWRKVDQLDYHHQAWMKAAGQVSETERHRSQQIVSQPERRFADGLRVSDPLRQTVDTVSRSLIEPSEALKDAYQQERLRLMQVIDSDSNYTVRMRLRSTKCPPPEAPAAANSRVRRLESKSVESFYPDKERYYGAQGRVIVRILVSATGCAEQMGIAESSGIGALDDAAIALVESGTFGPAADNGVAFASGVNLPVVFSLAKK
jgi:TonB family protein